MKKLKIILLLLSLTFACKAQMFVMSDRAWNVEATLDDYSGVYESHYYNDVSLESYTVSTNEIILDTVLGTLIVTRKSKQSNDSIYWNLTITSINSVVKGGTTYNFQDYINGFHGLLCIDKDNSVLFLVEKQLYPNEYFGFLADIEYIAPENCFTY